jgi:hypothetical protein
MMQEIVNQRLISERRRWFNDESMDLYVWYDADRTMIGFQVCFDRLSKEDAFTWLASGYTSVAQVDQGEDLPFSNMTPILVATKSANINELREQFRRRSKGIDPLVARHVGEILENAANQAL